MTESVEVFLIGGPKDGERTIIGVTNGTPLANVKALVESDGREEIHLYALSPRLNSEDPYTYTHMGKQGMSGD